jgi:CRP/FNR family transcriptional regulator
MLAKTSQSAKLVDFFTSTGVKQTFKKGEYIIRPGESPPGVFYIEEGLVKAYDITRYQEENLLIIRKSGEVFPLIWALTAQERSIIYQTLADTITWRVRRANLIDFIEANPGIYAPILDMTIEMYRLHSERIMNLEYRSVRERIISFLLTMSQRYAVKDTPQGLMIDVPLRHQDIASSVNASRETASRELSALEKKGLLSSMKSHIYLKDLDALKKYIDSD